jgi:hypothetical protein
LTYLLIFFVIAMAVGPLIHFLPSKRQKKIARLRECAALQGLFVQFRDTPAGVLSSPPGVIYYGKNLPSSRERPVETGVWFPVEDGWRSLKRGRPVPGRLEDISVEIVAASVDESSCGVYWTESADEEAVEQIRQFLEHWCDDLMG